MLIKRKIREVMKRNKIKELIYLNIGCLIVAISYNVFFLPYNLVCFGVSGLSIVFQKFGINPSYFIFITNILLLFFSFLLLGKRQTKNAIIGSLIYPIYIYITSSITSYIDFSQMEVIVIAIFGALLAGFGYGFIFKTSYSTGGTDIISLIISKYSKISLGKTKFFSDGLVILIGAWVFSVETLFYGIIVLYIISTTIDKMIIGISRSKVFYILTSKEKEVREFLLTVRNSGVTMIDARGGYSGDKKILFLAAIPTREYEYIKERLKLIDNDVFFLVCDGYEINRKDFELEI